MAKNEFKNQIYCSLDLELTGFVPGEDEILEVGFAFFDFHKGKLRILSTFNQLFNAKKPVPPIVLGLTGIKQAEVDKAPNIEDFKPELQEKLGDAILVGHNINFDISFLKSIGLQLSDKSIDTLEVAQVILPTNLSYNLESLMHTFRIPHKQAHRALADAIASAELLFELVALGSKFPTVLKKKITAHAKKWGIEWVDLINQDLNTSKKVQENKAGRINTDTNTVVDGNFIRLADRVSLSDAIEPILKKTKETNVYVVLKDKKEVLRVSKDNQLFTPHFSGSDTFSNSRFNLFIKNAKNRNEFLFILKIWVWQTINWQNRCLIDLNAHGSTGQLIAYVNGGKTKKSQNKRIISDYTVFLEQITDKKHKDRTVLIEDPYRFEQSILGKEGKRLNWYAFARFIKAIYNPETELGKVSYKKHAVKALADLDLFFALIPLLLKAKKTQDQYIKFEEIDPYYFNKLKIAADKLSLKLHKLPKAFKNPDFNQLIRHLKEYFSSENTALVKWIEFTESFPVLVEKPLDITQTIKKIHRTNKNIYFAQPGLTKIEVVYYAFRFGLDQKTSSKLSNSSYYTKNTGTEITETEFVDRLLQLDWPAVAILPQYSRVKALFEEHHVVLKEKGSVLAHGVTGGKNKVLRNFAINPKSLLITSNAMIYQPGTEVIKVKNLILFAFDPDSLNADPYRNQLDTYLEQFGIDLDTIDTYVFMRLMQQMIVPASKKNMYIVVK